MSHWNRRLRHLGFWAGSVLLLGSLLASVLLLLLAAFVGPLPLLLLPVSVGGLLLGALGIVRASQPRWAKLLAFLSPVLVPGLLLWGWLAWAAR
jgi:hypothetical protein